MSGRCKECRHWFATCVHGRPRRGHDPTWCYDCDGEPKVAEGRKGYCLRAGMDGGKPIDDASLMWGQDGSDYTADVYTRPDFGCVMWEPQP